MHGFGQFARGSFDLHGRVRDIEALGEQETDRPHQVECVGSVGDRHNHVHCQAELVAGDETERRQQEVDVQPEAVEVVAYRLRKKLAGTGAALVTLRGLGYLLKEGD